MPVRASGSFRRYLVPDLKPSPDDARFFEKVRSQRFKSIDDQATVEPSIGWVAPRSFGSSDFRPDNLFLGKVVLLRLRIDRKKLPTNAVKVRLGEALAGIGGKVAKAAKDKLRAEIEEELLKRTIPSTAVFDVYWRSQEGSVLLSSTAAAAHDAFAVLFKKTFGAIPEAAAPTPLSLKLGASLDKLHRLAPLSPAPDGAHHDGDG